MGNLALFLKTTRMNKVCKDHGHLNFKNLKCNDDSHFHFDSKSHDCNKVSILARKNDLYGKFLSSRTTQQFANIKEEISGLKQEKEDAFLTMQEQKRKLIYDKEEITITRMLNLETGK